jgi:hypothetical protein
VSARGLFTRKIDNVPKEAADRRAHNVENAQGRA